MRTYLDANVIVYASQAAEPGAAFRQAVDGQERLATSFLALDEAVWALRRIAGRTLAVEVAGTWMDRPDLEILSIGEREGRRALALMAEHGLDPHDATHAAAALEHGCDAILTDDADFDRVPGLLRLAP